MIRIKVFRLRKLLYKFILINIYVFLIILFVLLFEFFFTTQKVNLKSILNRKLAFYSFEIDNKLIIKEIIKNKIKIVCDLDIDDLAEENEQQTILLEEYKLDNLILTLENPKIENDETKFKEWKKAEIYNTSTLTNGKIQVGNVIINNYSKHVLDLNELKIASKFGIKDTTNFLLYHTHTSETYTINNDIYSDYYRTENENYNMISVGKVLKSELNDKGYNCVHDKTLHDYPSYNGAYKASLETVEKRLKENNFDFLIDIHRDAISSDSNFRPVAEIKGESVAKLMFVVGTDSGGLSHDKWIENLKLAILIQNRANEMYPGLFRELHLSSSRYNQHISNGALILEVGATGNSLEEAQNSMKYFANVIDSLKQNT